MKRLTNSWLIRGYSALTKRMVESAIATIGSPNVTGALNPCNLQSLGAEKNLLDCLPAAWSASRLPAPFVVGTGCHHPHYRHRMVGRLSQRLVLAGERSAAISGGLFPHSAERIVFTVVSPGPENPPESQMDWWSCPYLSRPGPSRHWSLAFQ